MVDVHSVTILTYPRLLIEGSKLTFVDQGVRLPFLPPNIFINTQIIESTGLLDTASECRTEARERERELKSYCIFQLLSTHGTSARVTLHRDLDRHY